jgi:hypothetical protein
VGDDASSTASGPHRILVGPNTKVPSCVCAVASERAVLPTSASSTDLDSHSLPVPTTPCTLTSVWLACVRMHVWWGWVSRQQAQQKVFKPDRVPVYCTCEMPYNPDQKMVMCEACKDWCEPHPG